MVLYTELDITLPVYSYLNSISSSLAAAQNIKNVH